MTVTEHVSKFFDLKTICFIVGWIVSIAIIYGVAKERLHVMHSRIEHLEGKIIQLDNRDLASGIQRAELKVELSAVHSEVNTLKHEINDINQRSQKNQSDIDWLKQQKIAP